MVKFPSFADRDRIPDPTLGQERTDEVGSEVALGLLPLFPECDRLEEDQGPVLEVILGVDERALRHRGHLEVGLDREELQDGLRDEGLGHTGDSLRRQRDRLIQNSARDRQVGQLGVPVLSHDPAHPQRSGEGSEDVLVSSQLG